jgi:hypothetical protein
MGWAKVLFKDLLVRDTLQLLYFRNPRKIRKHTNSALSILDEDTGLVVVEEDRIE